MNKRRLAIGIVFLLIVAIVVVVIILMNQPTFKGERIKNPDFYEMEFTRMQGEDSHTIYLSSGDKLEVTTRKISGKYSIIIENMGEEIYKSNNVEDMNFVLNITKEGNYTIHVKAQKAQGSLIIKKIK